MFPNQMVRPSIFSRGLSLAKSINWSGILDGTQKTLGVINQAIPIVYQVKPIINNAKTMFKIADVMRSPMNEYEEKVEVTKPVNTNKPIFYI